MNNKAILVIKSGFKITGRVLLEEVPVTCPSKKGYVPVITGVLLSKGLKHDSRNAE